MDDVFPPEALISKLAGSSVLSRCTNEEVARLLPLVQQRWLQHGEMLCRAGDPAKDTWLILQGRLRVKLDGESFREVSDGLVGEEAALGIDRYLSDIIAEDRAAVLILPKDVIPERVRDRDNPALEFCRSLVQIFTRAKVRFESPKDEERRLTAAVAVPKAVGWLAAVILPAVLLWAGPRNGLRWEQTQLAAALSSAAMLWMFSLAPAYVTGLLVVLVCATLGIVPTSVVLSGFASSGFFLALSVFSLGAVLIESGFTSRMFLLIIKYCPQSGFWYDFAILLSGLLLTPLVPSVIDRARVLAPLATDSVRSLGYAEDSRETTHLMLSAFIGLSMFSPMLLTGSPLNLALYGSLPDQVQAGFPWLRWAAAALVTALFVLAGYILFSLLVFRDAPRPRLSQETIDAQLKVLGPMRSLEWLAVGGAVLFLGAVSTVSLHKIDHRLIALTVICGYLVLGALGRVQLNLDIDWSALILLGTVIGMVSTIMYVNLHQVIAEHAVWLSNAMKYHPDAFIVAMAATVSIGGLVIPQPGALAAVYAVPLAVFTGMNPWVVVFVVLLMTNTNLRLSRSYAYQTFRPLVRSHVSYDERLFRRVHTGMVVVRLIALGVSIPYWHYLRLL